MAELSIACPLLTVEGDHDISLKATVHFSSSAKQITLQVRNIVSMFNFWPTPFIYKDMTQVNISNIDMHQKVPVNEEFIIFQT